MTSCIPDQLTALDQWVTWVHERRGDKPTKVPYISGTNRRASSTDRSTWTPYADAVADRTKSGVGFVFSDDDPFVGVDLDDCIDADGVLKPWATEIVDSLPATYTEVSPSGNGLKMFFSGELPTGGRNRRHIGDGQIELYARGRFFTVTGNRWGDTPATISRADLKPLHDRLFTTQRPAADTSKPDDGGGFGGSNDAMIEAIRRSKQGDQFARLYDDGPGTDHSADDLALCNILAFWCGPNPKRIDRVFRTSALYRDKWDRDDYRDRTIEQAIAGQTAFYQPPDSVFVNQDSRVYTRASEGRPFAMTDIGNAERMAEHFKGRIRHCERGGGWYVWDGSRWSRDDTGRVVFYAIKTVREIHAEAGMMDDTPGPDGQLSPAATMRKHGIRSESQSRIAAMIKLAASLPGVAIDAAEFDADPWLFNCRNGVIDLRTGGIREHRPDDNITKVSPASYHPAGTPRIWMSFLDRIFHGNVELIEYVQELLGMCLSGDIREQVMPVFYGEGSNGKSTLLDTVMAVMGSYAGKAAPDLLMARQGDVHPTEIADLWGLRLAVASETEQGKKLRVSTVKEMTGDAELKARYMRGDFFNFRRTHKLILMTNHKPRITEGKNAIWRRLKLVPFEAEITEAERDKDLADKLRAEWTGILAWLVRGCMRWHESGGLDDPAEVRAATEAYRDDEDPLSEFVAARVEMDKDGFVGNSAVRAAYQAWCKSESVASPLGERSLIGRLAERRGVKKERRSIGGQQVRGLSGMRINTGVPQ